MNLGLFCSWGLTPRDHTERIPLKSHQHNQEGQGPFGEIRPFSGSTEKAVEGGGGNEENPVDQCSKYLPHLEFPASLTQRTW